MDAFLGGLLVAAITGAVIAAYRHPSAYQRLIGVVTIFYLAGLGVITGYIFGFNDGKAGVLKLVSADGADPDALAKLNTNGVFTFSVLAAVGYLFLLGLQLLPRLGLSKDSRE